MAPVGDIILFITELNFQPSICRPYAQYTRIFRRGAIYRARNGRIIFLVKPKIGECRFSEYLLKRQ